MKVVYDFVPRYLRMNRNGSSKHSRFDRLTDFAAQAHNPRNTGQVLYQPEILFVIPRRSRRDIVLVSSVRPSVHLYIRPTVHTFCLSGTISQYLFCQI